ncbi:HD-GYP domain-containing protein [Paraburkholderia xenovorans]|uniref:HD-GYP domain-containing protein n=1 Tax=Paraburkholderia xenovorans TaxID=36873 RepID=UPI0038BD68FD
MTPKKILSLVSRFFGQSEPAHSADQPLLDSLLALAWVVEARDPYTGGHLWRVSRYASLLARQMGLSDRDAANVSVGGFVHDLGKIAIPDSVLLKTERLTDAEYAVIKTHPEIGKRLLAKHPFGERIADAVYAHHERPDGKGYPLGLTGNEITPMAAIIGICDAFDAMTSTRSYRKAMSIDDAFAVVRDNLGTQFNREYGEMFLKLGGSVNLYHIAGHSDEGIPLQHCHTCGPTIVVRSDTPLDAEVFCPACTTGYRFKGLFSTPRPTGNKANAADLAPSPDLALIERVAGQLRTLS